MQSRLGRGRGGDALPPREPRALQFPWQEGFRSSEVDLVNPETRLRRIPKPQASCAVPPAAPSRSPAGGLFMPPPTLAWPVAASWHGGEGGVLGLPSAPAPCHTRASSLASQCVHLCCRRADPRPHSGPMPTLARGLPRGSLFRGRGLQGAGMPRAPAALPSRSWGMAHTSQPHIDAGPHGQAPNTRMSP